MLGAVRSLARKIELLHPQVTAGGSIPSNCEYPWEGARGEIFIPAEADLGIDLRNLRAAVTMIKAVRARAASLATSAQDRL